jgi:hypothetical protein
VAQKIVAVVVGVVGLYLNIWHSNPLPFNHFQVFGCGQGGFGSQHYIHSLQGWLEDLRAAACTSLRNQMELHLGLWTWVK